MSNIIDSIQLSGVTYQIQGSGGGGVLESTFTAYTATTDERISQDEEVTAAGLNALNDKITPTVELTQAQYDALVDKDPNTFYIITDAEAGDLTNYYTKTETNTLLGGKADTATTYTKTEVDTALSGYVTTDTEQTISGRKIFTYTANSGKAIEFKQIVDTAKVGFRVLNSASTNNELATFEFRPNTFTIDNVQHPLLYFGHYRNKNTANAGVPQTVIGFRQYDQLNAAAYHYLMPLPEKAKTPFSLTTSFKDYYAPMGFKNGSTMITADNTGVADFSSVLGGLKLVKITQSAYDALTTKDDNTVYFIGDSTNGYTMKIGSANVN